MSASMQFTGPNNLFSILISFSITEFVMAINTFLSSERLLWEFKPQTHHLHRGYAKKALIFEMSRVELLRSCPNPLSRLPELLENMKLRIFSEFQER